MTSRRARSRFASLLLAATLLPLSLSSAARAGDFAITWGTSPYTWTSGALGPQTYALTDQYGFQLNARLQITRIGGAAAGGTPDDLTGYGTNRSLQLQWNANSGSSGIGESTNTATLEVLNGTTAYPVDNLSFLITDIDATDGNANSDVCDFVTVTGNTGTPTLSYVSATAATRSVRIGPGAGSGSTPTLASNQAQCIYNTGSTSSPSSGGDANGSIRATFPAGTRPMRAGRWAAASNSGMVFDATESSTAYSLDRTAVSGSVGYRIDDNAAARLKGEYRQDNPDDGGEDVTTYLISAGINLMMSDDWRFIASGDAVFADASETTRAGEYVEASAGFAYRAADSDRLNALIKYTFLHDLPGADQVTINGTDDGTQQISHIFSGDVSYDLIPMLTAGREIRLPHQLDPRRRRCGRLGGRQCPSRHPPRRFPCGAELGCPTRNPHAADRRRIEFRLRRADRRLSPCRREPQGGRRLQFRTVLGRPARSVPRRQRILLQPDRQALTVKAEPAIYGNRRTAMPLTG